MGMVVHDLIPVLKSQRRAVLGEFQALSQKKKSYLVTSSPLLHPFVHRKGNLFNHGLKIRDQFLAFQVCPY